jgi:hypothetical protein
MPAPPLSNTLEGGTDTTTITTGNSGGASGDAFNNVVIGASATETFSATHAAHGGLAMKITQPASGVSTYVDWTGFGTLTTDVWFRLYVYRTANGSSEGYVVSVRNAAAAACCYIAISAAGIIRIWNASSAQAALTGSVAVGLNQWVRIEMRVFPSTTIGEIDWWLYNTPDAPIGSHDETKSATGLVLAANVDQVRWGMPSTPQPVSESSWYDDLAVSTAGQLGPAGAPPPPATTVPQLAAQGARW